MKKALEYFVFVLFILVTSLFVVDLKYKNIVHSAIADIHKSQQQQDTNKNRNKEEETTNKLLNKKDLRFKVGSGSALGNEEDLFKYVVERIKASYVEDVDEKKIYENALSGVLSALDPHSAYLTEKNFREMQVQTKGEFGGLGVVITKDMNFIKVISPLEDTPAFRIGILPGDYISQINNKTTYEMSLYDAVEMMRGKVGEKVKLVILRKGESKPLEFELKREIIKIDAVKGEIINGNIMYIKINNFVEATQRDVIGMYNKLKTDPKVEKNIAGFILDLRNNPGGLLEQSVKVSELFLEKDKVVVSIKGKEGQFLESYKTGDKGMMLPKSVPMVVLVNDGSASAAEIVAGALQDHKRAIIIGIKTFGKASVQQIFPLTNGGAIKLTIARYYTPSGRSLQVEGIVPDIIARKGEMKFEKDDLELREGDLDKHLKREDVVDEAIRENRIKKNEKEEVRSDIRDYQLLRAVDLINGINFFKNNEN
ncbi:MAG: S41 family peptidase [Rickettsiales bacterium]|jgi:carboxyl-terminal processing protease|nr:S41 family peptidase [Rickettsiales bacterium]